MNEHKVCEDCKNYQPNTVTWKTPEHQMKYAICTRTSIVTRLSGTDCEDERASPFIFINHCGKKARFFEARK